MIDRDVYRAAGELGIVGLQIPEEFGGGGQDGFLFNCVVTEQVAYERSTMGSLRVHTDVVTPYVLSLATSDQRQRWLPGMANGELMTSIAMTEPGAGSDLAGIRTSLDRRGSDWVLNGSKTFITGGAQSDLVIVVARSEAAENRRHGLTLAVVEASTPGFSRGAPLEKLGLKAQDTTELFFDDVVVPADNILGEPGRAFTYLSSHLAQERLSIAVNSQAQALAALAVTCEYVRDRKVFGTTLGTFQNTKFVLADLATRVSAGQALVDRAMGRHERGDGSTRRRRRRSNSSARSSTARWSTPACNSMAGTATRGNRTSVACTQTRGSRGSMGGTSEVMKGIVARTLNLVDR